MVPWGTKGEKSPKLLAFIWGVAQNIFMNDLPQIHHRPRTRRNSLRWISGIFGVLSSIAVPVVLFLNKHHPEVVPQPLQAAIQQVAAPLPAPAAPEVKAEPESPQELLAKLLNPPAQHSTTPPPEIKIPTAFFRECLIVNGLGISVMKASIDHHKWDGYNFPTEGRGYYKRETNAISFMVVFKNMDRNKKIKWKEPRFQLTDEHGNVYESVDIAPQFIRDNEATKEIKPSMYPSDVVTIIAGFEPPIMSAQELSLKVEAAETVVIKIPCANGLPIQSSVKAPGIPRN